MRARTNIALKNRYTATLTDFKGVDLNTSPLRVAPNRASSMKNFICDNGILHKRPGWEEQLRITDDSGNALAIHVIFPFSEDGNEILLIHAGTGIYRAEKKDGKWEYECKSGEIEGIDENRASCFYRGGKAYIAGCGNFLCYGKHEGENYTLREASEIAYVPTTTYGIGGSEGQTNLEPVNLLTRKRINTLMGNNEEGAYGQCQTIFELDSRIASNTVVSIKGSCYYDKDNDGYAEFVLDLDETFCVDKDGKATWKIPRSQATTDALSYQHAVQEYYYITAFLHDDSPNTKIMISFPTGSRDRNPNITITFYAEGGEGYAQRIKNCRFGTTFGVNDRHANERLFLAGNPDHPNMDFWSEADDFTYFPDGNTMEVGSAHAAINGYARLSDTTLAVLKEEKAGEPTIFYRTGAEKHDTENLKYDAYFPVAAGIAGDGIVNHHAGATLAGDVMVLTRSGVRALVLSSNVASGERYMHDRSRPIYRELVSSGELANAAGIVYRNRYYLALPDAGKCYVADAHYKAAFDGSTDYNYEWWVWDNVHATCFAEYEDKLLFGTPDGLICAFAEGTFADRTYTDFGEGDLLLSGGSGHVDCNKDKTPVVGDRVVLTGGVYALLATVTEVKDGVCKALNADAFYEGQEVYADSVEGCGLSTGTAYVIGDLDVVDQTFCLLDKGGEKIKPQVAGFHLLECLDGEEIYVSRVDEEKGAFAVARGWLYHDGEKVWNELWLAQYNGQMPQWEARTSHIQPVRAEWVTPIMDFGTNASSKTLLSMTIATEPGTVGAVSFGYETRRQIGDMALLAGDGLDFSALDFNNISFDGSIARSFTKRMNVRNFNFIVFRFGSDIEQDCAVSGVTLQYKINRKNYGLR